MFDTGALVRFVGNIDTDTPAGRRMLWNKEPETLMNEVLRVDFTHRRPGADEPHAYLVSQHIRKGKRTGQIYWWNEHRSPFRFYVQAEDLVPADGYKQMTPQDYEESFEEWVDA